jgi:hypothetical protein
VPFDQKSVRTLVDRLSPAERGLTGAVALDRIRVVLDVDLEVEALVETRGAVDAAVRLGLRRATGSDSGNPSAVLAALRALLPDEADEDPFVGDEEWTVNVMAMAVDVVRCGLSSEGSAGFCVNALLYAYSVAGYLEDDLNLPYDQPYADEEAARQISDIYYLTSFGRQVDDGAIDHLKISSASLRDRYAARMRRIIEES